jgi:phosphohistidine phosphatase
MGAIQDGTLFLDLAQNSLVKESTPSSVQDFYGRRMAGAFSSYLAVKDQIHTFWRSAPRARFPWGKEIQLKGQRLMDLHIIRHAIAVESGSPGYEDDSQRPLTDKGRKKMKKIARGIGALGVDFDCVISSPYTRARQTAEILVDELKLKDKLTFSDALVPPGDFDRLVHEISEKNDLNSLALVGHEPMLSQFIGWLSTGGGGMSLALKKGGLAYLTSEDLVGTHRATLQWLLSPATMVAING